MKFALVLVASMAFLASAVAQFDFTACSFCGLRYNPVCGTDGKTYNSPCMMNCETKGVEVAYIGRCEGDSEQDLLQEFEKEATQEEGTVAKAEDKLEKGDVKTETTEEKPVDVEQDVEMEEIEEGCFCPAIFDPVCGTDGKTYSSSCSLGCTKSGVKESYKGACIPREECVCLAYVDPVCGVDGKTYSNECQLKCAYGIKAYKGECRKEPCLCLDRYDPVCATNGKTYSNSCRMSCEGATLARKGACGQGSELVRRSSCICTQEYKPVCGDDGKTYSNACRMRCAGAKLSSKNACGSGI